MARTSSNLASPSIFQVQTERLHGRIAPPHGTAPGSDAGRAHILALAGDEAGARAILERVEAARAAGSYASPMMSAVVHTALGDTEDALDDVEQAIAARDEELLLAAIDPRLDRLHAFPRFEALLRGAGLWPP